MFKSLKKYKKNKVFGNYYPFLFFLPKNNDYLDTTKVSKDTWFVKIARFDYGFLDVRWMDDRQLGNLVLTPGVDITVETRVFHSEKKAMKFIKNWWKNIKIKKKK